MRPACAGTPPQCCYDQFDLDTCEQRNIDKGTCQPEEVEDLEGTCCVDITQREANCNYQRTRYRNCTVPAGACPTCNDLDLVSGEYNGNDC